jgi:16S rRNA (guanine1516-N2)-methyltransferase
VQIIVFAEHEFYILKAKQFALDLELDFGKQLFDLSQWKKQSKIFLKNRKTRENSYCDGEDDQLLLLIVGEQGISLLATWSDFSPLSVDFESEVWSRRLRELSIKNELLAKALGIKKQEPITILDANAGLGQDAFIMAALGCKVWCTERSPVIHCLLSDGFARARNNPALKSIVDAIELRCIDAKNLIENPPLSFDVIYLDPMFPEKKGNALVKKEMQIFQKLLGADEDADVLVQAALDVGCKRVVLKRPAQADFALGKKPDLQFEGSSTRFDVYLNHLL